MRIVGSLTTIPSRIEQIEKTLLSISNQSYKLDAVYFYIPYLCLREDSGYQIPDTLTNYCHIIRGQDYGPITKIVGALISEHDPDTIIITFDDDKIYPEELVKKLVSKHRIKPDCAIGSSGFKIGTFPFYISMTFNEYSRNKHWYAFDVGNLGEKVDVLLGSPGVLYVRKFFPDVDHLEKLLWYSNDDDNVLFRNDNIVISGLLSQRGVQRRVYRMPSVQDSKSDNPNSTTGYACSLFKAIHRARKEGMFKKQVEYTRSKTITYPLIMGLGMIILFIILFSTRN